MSLAEIQKQQAVEAAHLAKFRADVAAKYPGSATAVHDSTSRTPWGHSDRALHVLASAGSVTAIQAEQARAHAAAAEAERVAAAEKVETLKTRAVFEAALRASASAAVLASAPASGSSATAMTKPGASAAVGAGGLGKGVGSKPAPGPGVALGRR